MFFLVCRLWQVILEDYRSTIPYLLSIIIRNFQEFRNLFSILNSKHNKKLCFAEVSINIKDLVLTLMTFHLTKEREESHFQSSEDSNEQIQEP